MRTSRVVPALFGAALLVGGVAAPASAQTVTKDDPSGDAPARIDITKVRYTHESDRVRVSAKIPELGRSGTADFLVSRYEIFEAGYVVRIRQHQDQPAKVSLLYFDHFDLKKRTCKGISGSWGPQVVRLKVPRSCLKGHATKYVSTQFLISYGAGGERFDEAPMVKRLRRS